MRKAHDEIVVVLAATAPCPKEGVVNDTAEDSSKTVSAPNDIVVSEARE